MFILRVHCVYARALLLPCHCEKKVDSQEVDINTNIVNPWSVLRYSDYHSTQNVDTGEVELSTQEFVILHFWLAGNFENSFRNSEMSNGTVSHKLWHHPIYRPKTPLLNSGTKLWHSI